jgi:hypothetical protein
LEERISGRVTRGVEDCDLRLEDWGWFRLIYWSFAWQDGMGGWMMFGERTSDDEDDSGG